MSEKGEETVNLTIDGTPICVPKGTLVIEAARRVGIMIPHFCYHPKLDPDANCRMCLVEVEKVPRLQTSCSTPATEGMVVRTATSVVNEAHKSVLEFILANHPLDCPVCDQGGRCDLQDFSHQYTPTTSRFAETKRIFPKEYFSRLIETQMNRCVQCLRCVRYCDEVMDVKALAPAGRGTMTEIKHFTHHELDCEFCGGCVQICPVGAITSRLSMYQYRPWMLKRADTICAYCGDGCNITIQTKGNQLIEVNSAHGAGRNNGDLCARGFFGYHCTTDSARLTHPLIRQNGQLVETTWEDALDYVAEQALRLKAEQGPDVFAGLATSRCTNEDLYVFQKFMRLVLGTNQIDSSARYGHINGIRALRRVQGTHRWTVSFEDIAQATCLMLVGTNITETNPVTGLKVKEAVKRRNATLITIEALEPAVESISNIVNLSSHHISSRPGQWKNVVLGVIKAILDEGLSAQSVARNFVESIAHAVGKLQWPAIEQATGTTHQSYKATAHSICRSNRFVVLVGAGVLRSEFGEEVTTLLLDLLLLSGHHGQPGCGIAPLAEENNDQGAVEMGVMADYLPGPVDLSDTHARQRFSGYWNHPLPQQDGVPLMGILQRIQTGAVKALFVLGENPAESLPPSTGIETALRELDLLVCHELFLTETAKLAHVVFPASSYAEKDGTFTNTEGHVQYIRPAIDPIGESRPDWEILSVLATLMDHPMEYDAAKDILKEIRSVIPGYGLIGPGPAPTKPDASIVNRYLQDGYASDVEQRYRLALAGSGATGSYLLWVGQSLFHSGKYSTRAKGLMEIQSEGAVTVNADAAKHLGVKTGQSVYVSNNQGRVEATLKISGRVPAGMAWFPEHFDQQIRSLLSVGTDPNSGVPYYKATWVTIEPING